MNWAGLKDEMNLTRIYQRYRRLFTKHNINLLRSLRQQATGDQARRLLYLERFLIGNILDNTVKRHTDRMETLKSKLVVQLDHEKFPYRQVPVVIANEERRPKRSRLYWAYAETATKINPTVEERMRLLQATARRLGYRNYVELYAKIKAIDFKKVVVIAKRLLKASETLFRETLDAKLREYARVGLDEAESPDVTYLVRAKRFDRAFKKDRLVPTLKATLVAMGIRLEHQKNIDLDLEERPKKSPRAFCAPIRVPQDVKLVIKPRGGPDDYSTLFHEAGHAEHFANIASNAPIEYKYLVSNSIAEIFSFQLENITFEPAWLDQHIRLAAQQEYVEYQQLVKAYTHRFLAGMILYELTLHDDGMEGAREAYRRHLQEALKVKFSDNFFLINVDDGFYSVEYLLASMLEAQLRAHLKADYGDAWFHNKAAGSYLRHLWQIASRYEIEELAKTFDPRGLDPTPLIAELSTPIRL